MDDADLAVAIQTRYPQLGSQLKLIRWSKNSGFSGHPVYRIQTDQGLFALKTLVRRTHDPLGSFHQRVLLACEDPRTSLLAVPLLEKSGSAWFRHREHDWEVTRWLPGAADFNSAPSLARLKSVLEELAGFHRRAAIFCRQLGPSRTLQHRAAELATWSRDLESLKAPLRAANIAQDFDSSWPLYQLLAQGIAKLLPRADFWSQKTWPLQPIIRDLWHDHLLFTDQSLSGVIDLETIAMDIVSCDLARLLGSLEWPDSQLWEVGLELYQHGSRLTPELVEVVPWLHGAGTVLGAIYWLKWLAIERRQFESTERVNQRLNWLLRSLQHWTNNT